MPVRYFTIGDAQQPITLNTLIAAPTIIRERFAAVMRNQFVMDQVLRGPVAAPGGAVQYRVSSGLFADQSSEIVNPRAEIPLATVTKGDLATKATRPFGLGVSIDWAMRDMDVTGEVNRQLGVLRNTLVRDIDGGFLSTLRTAITQTVAAAFPWANASATIRKNINTAKQTVQLAQAPGAAANSFLNFNPDTIIVNPQTQTDLLDSTEFIQMIFGQVQPSYGLDSLSAIPNGSILGLRPLVTVSQPAGEAIVLESGTIGGYADRVPLQMSDWYDWPPARISRCDAFRDTTGFVDQPLAGVRITGI